MRARCPRHCKPLQQGGDQKDRGDGGGAQAIMAAGAATAAALFALAASPLMPVKAYALFAGMAVLAQALVASMLFPPARPGRAPRSVADPSWESDRPLALAAACMPALSVSAQRVKPVLLLGPSASSAGKRVERRRSAWYRRCS
jgi:hypothetical protein